MRRGVAEGLVIIASIAAASCALPPPAVSVSTAEAEPAAGPRDAAPSLAEVLRRATAATVELHQGRRFLGCGVIVSAAGRVLTADHVLASRGPCDVRLATGETLQGTVSDFGRGDDVAMIELPPGRAYPHMPLAQALPERGTELFLVATQRALREVMVHGRLSTAAPRLQWNYNLLEYVPSVVVDGVTFPGASGAAWFTASGEVAGLASGLIWTDGRPASLSVAVPCTVLVQRAMNGPRPRQASTLRGQYEALSMCFPKIVEATGPGVSGIRVEKVLAGGPLSVAGLAAGDVITAIDERTFTELEPFLEHVSALAPGVAITLTYRRPGSDSAKTASTYPVRVRPSCLD